MPDDPSLLATPQTPPAADPAPERVGLLTRAFGPLTPWRVVVLVVAVAFLGGAAGYAFRDVESQAQSSVDVGFLRDMSVHHGQATTIARTAMAGGLPDGVAPYAEEIIVRQQYELGLMQATLNRYNEDPAGDGTAMGWMGTPVPKADMPGLASPEELAELESLDGEPAAALFFALMTRHHLGGLHMAEAAAEEATDPYVRTMADRMARGQRAEVVEYRSARARLGIGLPDGYPETPAIDAPAGRFDSGGGIPVVPLVLGVGVAGAVLLGGWAVARRVTLDGDGDPADGGTSA